MFTIKEYKVGEKIYRLKFPDADAQHRLARCNQRIEAHQANDNKVGVYEEMAEIWAVLFDTTIEEVLDLPFRTLLQGMKNLVEAKDKLTIRENRKPAGQGGP